MVSKDPKRSSGYQRNQSALAKQIYSDLKKRKMTQKELAIASGIPESRISRILRAGSVRVSEQDINQLALGLKKSVQERDQMRYLAWPELRYIDEALNKGEDVIELNAHLYENGLPLLGSDYLE